MIMQEQLDQLIKTQQTTNTTYSYWKKTSMGWVEVDDPHQRRTCSYCKLLVSLPTMKRWHGQNCYLNPDKDNQ